MVMRAFRDAIDQVPIDAKVIGVGYDYESDSYTITWEEAGTTSGPQETER
jgi:hypothetical protein